MQIYTLGGLIAAAREPAFKVRAGHEKGRLSAWGVFIFFVKSRRETKMKRFCSIGSIGAVLLAFLGSQHHTLHMLLLAAGLGGAGTGLMTAFPIFRRAMLLMSIAIVGVLAYRLRDADCPRTVRIVNGVSILLTLGIVAWSVVEFGL